MLRRGDRHLVYRWDDVAGVRGPLSRSMSDRDDCCVIPVDHSLDTLGPARYAGKCVFGKDANDQARLAVRGIWMSTSVLAVRRAFGRVTDETQGQTEQMKV